MTQSPRTVQLATVIKLCITIAVTLASVELISWWWFHHKLPAEIYQSALFTVEGELSTPFAGQVPKIQPYLWANYMPNPCSPQANQHGWRYGGGPKPEGHFRVLCLGGSTTWSDKVTAPEFSYPARLENYLQSKGWAVDVVNGGAPFFSSAELVGTLAFRGIYTFPDLVIIHTGGNDTVPLRSADEYQPDYTHWRTVDPSLADLSSTDKFRLLWKFPSWTTRLFLTMRMHPNSFFRATIAKQLSSVQEGLLADNDISDREPVGLECNLRSMIAISRTHGAQVACMTFNMRYENLAGWIPQIAHDPELLGRAAARLKETIDKSNEAILKVCADLAVPVIPFDEFEPSHPEYWADQCHLTDQGTVEKAASIGDFLIRNSLIPTRFWQDIEQ